MKNALSYYYSLTPDNIYQNENIVKFTLDNKSYALTLIDNDGLDINNIYELSMQLLQRRIMCHQIILNNSREIITTINGYKYVLLLLHVDNYNKISFNDLVYFNNITQNINTKTKPKDWFSLWCEKVDYLEYQISQFGKKYPIIRESFNYFVGLAENAILFYKLVHNKSSDNLSVCHYRIKNNYTYFDLYNPINFVLDLKIRDIAEYFKEKQFYTNEDVALEVEDYINDSNLQSQECLNLYSRLLFPTTYFDVFEDIIIDGSDEKNLLPIITKINSYELFLKDIYNYIDKIVKMPEIEWIKNLDSFNHLG